jgi:hypothetical protein
MPSVAKAREMKPADVRPEGLTRHARVLAGPGFNPAEKLAANTWALAPEAPGRLLRKNREML